MINIEFWNKIKNKIYESVELNLMNKGVLYCKAHKIANILEHNAIKHIRGKK